MNKDLFQVDMESEAKVTTGRPPHARPRTELGRKDNMVINEVEDDIEAVMKAKWEQANKVQRNKIKSNNNKLF